MARIGFRPTTLADESEIVALLQQAHGKVPGDPTLDHRHMYWKCWHPHEGWQGSRSYVLTKDERIVAHGTVVPAWCAWERGRISMLHVIDWAAQAEVRGAGAALMQHLGKLGDVIATSSGSDKARKLLPLMGFKASKTIVTGYARPIRPWLYYTQSDEPRWRRAARSLRASLWAMRAPSTSNASWAATRIRESAIASTPIPWPVPKHGIAVLERQPNVMTYMLQCPAAPMELYIVGRNASPEGYFMLAFTGRQARLVDCWLTSDAPDDWAAAVQLAVQNVSGRGGVAEIAVISSDPLFESALRQSGFHARFARPLFLCRTNGTELPDGTVRIQMIDDDKAYLQTAPQRLWA